MPRTSKLRQGTCDSCETLIEGAAISFSCKLHCLCLSCIHNIPELISDWTTTEGACPYCKLKGAVYIDKTEFKRPFALQAPASIAHMKNITLPDLPFCGWATAYDDVIAVGREDTSTVDIVNVNGQVVSHTLPVGSSVTSGLYLDTEKCFVSVSNPDKVFTCNINPQGDTPTSPNVLIALSAINPINVFALTEFKYGIFCTQPSRFEIFSKRAIYTEENSKPISTIHINLPSPEYLDRACSTPDGRVCVSSWNNGQVHIYDGTGTLTTSIGTVGDSRKTCSDGLYRPRSVEISLNGTIVVTCNWGDVLTYIANKGWEKIRSRNGMGTCAAVLSDTRFWIVLWSNNSVCVHNMQS